MSTFWCHLVIFLHNRINAFIGPSVWPNVSYELGSVVLVLLLVLQHFLGIGLFSGETSHDVRGSHGDVHDRASCFGKSPGWEKRAPKQGLLNFKENQVTSIFYQWCKMKVFMVLKDSIKNTFLGKSVGTL